MLLMLLFEHLALLALRYCTGEGAQAIAFRGELENVDSLHGSTAAAASTGIRSTRQQNACSQMGNCTNF